MTRTYISKIEPEKEIKISGWIERIRNSKNMIFIVLKDITGKIQVTIEKANNEDICNALEGIIANSVIEVTGVAHLSEYVKMGGIEMIPTSVQVLSSAEALPITEEANIDQKLDYRWIDLRSEKNTLMFQAQSCFTNAMRTFLVSQNFTEIHTPKIIGAASESGADVFELTYFDTKAYLAQSPQFYKQMAMASGFERIFECGPVFRAEKSYTNRHATEFTGFDIEFSYIESYEDVMNMEEDMIIAGLSAVKEKYGDKIKEVFDVDIVVPTKPFPRIKLQDLYSAIETKYGYTLPDSEKIDLTTEAEKLAGKYAMEEYGHEFIFVTDYPKDKRAFYHMRKDGVPQGYDLIWKGVEITTGAQREHRYDILKAQAEEKGLDKDVQFYLEFFKYGCPPHGGFGIGLDRITMLMLGVSSIKEAEFLFRGPNRLTP
ncbi:MAG: aspartate--tRNA(Asn) ligase [Clostridiales bacterium]|nr:aspartate--tRNA(Asn) ligase [Clostridiales bacterium]